MIILLSCVIRLCWHQTLMKLYWVITVKTLTLQPLSSTWSSILYQVRHGSKVSLYTDTSKEPVSICWSKLCSLRDSKNSDSVADFNYPWPKSFIIIFFLLKYTLLRQPLQKNRHLRFEHNVNFFETFKFAAILTLHSSQRQYYPDTTMAFCSRWRPRLLRVRTKFWKGPTEPCKFWWAKCARSEVMPISFTGTVPLHEYSPR